MSQVYTEESLLSAVVPLLKLLCLTVMGLVLAHPKTQIIPKSTFKLLSKLVFALFLPCLTFIHLGRSITLENISHWWFIPVNALISTFIGSLLGVLVVFLCRPPPRFVRFTIITVAFGNTGNLPIAILGSVCHTHDNPFGPNCRQRGVAYVSFAQWVSVILVYTLVYHMMEPPLEYNEVVEEDGDEVLEGMDGGGDGAGDVDVDVNMSRPLLVEAEWPGIEEKETEHCKTPFIARVFRSSYNVVSSSSYDGIDHSHEGSGNSPKSIGCLAEPRMVRRIRTVAERTPYQHILQPPTIASLLAILVGIVPHAKSLFFGVDAPLSFLTDSLEIMGGAMVPSVMLMLGGMLSEGPNDSKLGVRTTFGIILARLLLLPLFGIGIVALAAKLHLLIEGDQMYRFVLLLQYTTPSAILLGAIASMRGYALKESSAILFWQHLFALLSLSLYIAVYFKLLRHA